MDFELDVHTHTIASGHAYGTLTEMAKEAAVRGLKLLGITEHTHNMPGTCDDLYFVNLRVVPREMFGIRLMLGAELNIMDYEGTVDLPDWIIDWICGLPVFMEICTSLERWRKIRPLC